jgi:hypothetical protein
MPDWVPPTIIVAYAAIVILLALTGVFGETAERRDAAYKVLRAVLPWGLVTIVADAVISHYSSTS